MMTAGGYKNALVVASETLSRVTNWQDRDTCVLFGDGAGAAVLKKGEDQGEILDLYLAPTEIILPC